MYSSNYVLSQTNLDRVTLYAQKAVTLYIAVI